MVIPHNASLSQGVFLADGLLPLALHVLTLIGDRPAWTHREISNPDLLKGCDHYQKVSNGYTQYIYSPGYDTRKSFPDGIVCRWVAESPENSRLELNCMDFKVGEMSHSGVCTNDRFLVSPTGDPAMTDAEMHCGKKIFKMKSVGNKMLLLFFSDHKSNRRDRFFCSLKAVQHETCDCGRWNKMQIYNGVEADINEFPMMAGLLHTGMQQLICGAAIISRRYAITAAHCFPEKIPQLKKYLLLVGGHNSSNIEDSPSSVLYRISQIIIHPRYKNYLNGEDIALLKVGYSDQDGIQFNENVGPVCLPFRYYTYSFSGEHVTLPGWGASVLWGHGSEVLMETFLTILPVETCKYAFYDDINYRQICTYAEESGPCQGDSGGPLLWLDRTTDRLHTLGVISYAKGCDPGIPAVSTRVTSYLNWIVFTTNEEFCIL